MAKLTDLEKLLNAKAEEPDKDTKEPPRQFKITDTVANPMFAPQAWQTGAPDDLFSRGQPIGESADLRRIMALPRRAPLDLESPTAEAVVELAMQKFGKHNPNCECRKIAPNRSSCITRLLPIQAWALREIGIAQGLLASVPVGGGKCAEKSTVYFDYATGRRRSVAEPGEVNVATFERSLFVTPASAFPSGMKPCVEFKLADGSSAKFSTDHPILTHRGWVEAAQLIPGSDFVTVAVEMPDVLESGTTQASDDEVKFVAYMLSDGGCSQSTMGFTNMNPTIIRDWAGAAKRLGYSVAEVPSRSQARQFALRKGAERGDDGRYRAVDDPIRERWGLYGLAKDKRMHASLWGLPRRQVALFLNRFWACDGHVKDTRGFELILASEKLIDDVRFLCTRLGIRTRKHYKKASYVKNGTRIEFDAWRITAYGSAALKFLDEVGDILGKESQCKSLRARLEVTKRNTNTDLVPVGFDEFHEICTELGILGNVAGYHGRSGDKRRADLFRRYGVTRGQYLSRHRFVQFCEETGYTGKYAHLATTDVAWEKVVSVKDIGIHDVYDLTVPGTHNFVANGIVVHNTILGLLAPLVLDDAKTCLMLIPSSLLDQIERDYLLLSQHFHVPGIIVHGSKSKNPLRRTYPGVPTLHVLAYTRLSLPTSSDWIRNLAPDAIIADEVDSLKDTTSSRTMRVMKYFAGDPDMTPEEKAKRRKTKFCGWTGSLTDHSLTEFAHLSLLALRERSPLPLDPNVVEEWSKCLDATENPYPPGALLDLCDPGEDVRHAVRRRMAETPGFIIQGGEDTIIVAGGTSEVEIDVRERDAPELPPIVEQALAMVRQGIRPDSLSPDGQSEEDEELEDQMAIARCAQEIASGMFYRWIFPRGEPVDVIKEWFRRRRAWNKELRLKAMQGETYLDSALLCTQAAMRAWGDAEERKDRPEWKAENWPAWRDFMDKVKPKTQAVRLHDFLAQDAAKWGHENQGSIIWYQMKEFGYWVREIGGFPIHEGGPQGGKKLMAEKGDRTILSSLKSNYRGRDGLQDVFSRQLVANTPSSATIWEQLLGRLHRRGQKSEQVITEVYLHTPELVKSFEQAIRRGNYVHDIIGARHKLLRGTGR